MTSNDLLFTIFWTGDMIVPSLNVKHDICVCAYLVGVSVGMPTWMVDVVWPHPERCCHVASTAPSGNVARSTPQHTFKVTPANLAAKGVYWFHNCDTDIRIRIAWSVGPLATLCLQSTSPCLVYPCWKIVESPFKGEGGKFFVGSCQCWQCSGGNFNKCSVLKWVSILYFGS